MQVCKSVFLELFSLNGLVFSPLEDTDEAYIMFRPGFYRYMIS